MVKSLRFDKRDYARAFLKGYRHLLLTTPRKAGLTKNDINRALKDVPAYLQGGSSLGKRLRKFLRNPIKIIRNKILKKASSLGSKVKKAVTKIRNKITNNLGDEILDNYSDSEIKAALAQLEAEEHSVQQQETDIFEQFTPEQIQEALDKVNKEEKKNDKSITSNPLEQAVDTQMDLPPDPVPPPLPPRANPIPPVVDAPRRNSGNVPFADELINHRPNLKPVSNIPVEPVSETKGDPLMIALRDKINQRFPKVQENDDDDEKMDEVDDSEWGSGMNRKKYYKKNKYF